MTYSVLIYPNWTYQRDLEADSFTVAVGGMIRALNAVRDDLTFTLLTPREVESLRFDNVRQVHYPLPSYPSTMRAHFDTRDFLRAIDWKARSYDIVWSHLPEHTAQIKNVMFNATNERPVFVGYSHWFELPENTAYLETLFPANLNGILSMTECGVNSNWLRELVREHADAILSAPRMAMLDEILHVQTLGVESGSLPPGREPELGLLVFNHRANAYTGFDYVLRVLDDLWEKRQDFRLMLTLADADRPYVTREPAHWGRDSYLQALSRAWCGIGAFRRYSAWSVSVTDGLSMGVPYLLPNALAYPEMVGRDYPLLYEPGELRAAIERVLDGAAPLQQATSQLPAIVKSLEWGERIGPIATMFDRAIALLPTANETGAYTRVRRLADQGMSKSQLTEEMGWGVRVPWTGYRNRLRNDGVEVGVDWYGANAPIELFV